MRFTTAAEAVKLIRPHSSVYIQGSTSIPEVLVRAMTDRAAEAWLSEPVTVHLFRDNGSYKEDKIVTVNGETVRIPRGEDVTIARRFALVLAQGEAQDARTGALIERETARFAAESGALGL